ncbi:cold adaptation protein AtcB [Aeromonas molluscorum]|uniref:cold adaptation protein AtcB n=1 Tax=Aeromonas molluscorum TaxID=271417 RepID=UPI003F1A4B79
MNSLIEIAAIEIKELAVIEPKQASEKFELIAMTMSDDQLAEVIENIDIVTLTQINGQHDISFPSIISELMTPERIRDIVCQQPLYWEEAIKNNAEELQQHTFDFLNYLIRTQESEAKQREILECIAEDPAGLFYLAIPFIEFYRGEQLDDKDGVPDLLHAEEEDLEEALSYSDRQLSENAHDYSLDDPRSLLMLIRQQAPEVEQAIKALLRNENSSWDGIINKFAAELVMQAKDKNQVSDEYSEVDDMFSFLD